MNDADIVKLLIDRDEAAIGELVKKYGKDCRAIAAGILGSESDAEECVNDMLMRVWNSVPSAKPDNLGAYVHKAARNIAINRYKAQRRKKHIPPDKIVPLEEAENVGVTDIDPTDKEAVAALIAAYLREAGEEKRGMFVARYFHGLGEAEIARKSGMAEGTVSSTLSRMRKGLNEYLKAEGIEI